jgi:hypothetical protein
VSDPLRLTHLNLLSLLSRSERPDILLLTIFEMLWLFESGPLSSRDLILGKLVFVGSSYPRLDCSWHGGIRLDINSTVCSRFWEMDLSAFNLAFLVELDMITIGFASF